MTKIIVKEVRSGKQIVPIRITEEYEVDSNFIQFYAGSQGQSMTPEIMHEIYAR